MKKFFTLLILTAFVAISVAAQILQKSLWGVNGNISAIISDKDYTYLGGNFDYIGPVTGPAAIVSKDNLFPEPHFPIVKGKILTSLPDGNGGWYIGGDFHQVGNEERNGLAHIYNDGTLSPWNPDVNGQVDDIAIDNNSIYVAGLFTKVGAADMQNVAKVDLTTGKPDTAWNPHPNDEVYAVAIDNHAVFVGGRFRGIAGTSKSFAAKLRSKDGTLDSAWNVMPYNMVYTITIHNGVVYLGGTFTAFWGVGAAYYVARVNETDGAPIRPFWAPNPNSYVKKIIIANGKAYLVGDFTKIGHDTIVNRNRVACVGTDVGKVDLLWDPEPDNYVNDLFVSGDDIYLAGDFKSVGGVDRNYLAKVDDSWGQVDKNWKLQSDGPVYCFSMNNDKIFVGGVFSSVGGVMQYGLARLRNTDFTFDLNWFPKINKEGSVSCLAQDDAYLYAGGDFSFVDSVYIRHLAKIDKMTARPDTNWKPSPDKMPETLALEDTNLFVGGSFDYIGALHRSYLAKVNTRTGYADQGWNLDISDNLPYGSVHMLHINGSNVYVGGRFYNENRTRIINYFHRLSIDNANPDPMWDPNPNGLVWDMAVKGNSIFVSGVFTNIGGREHKKLAKLDYRTGMADDFWQSDVDQGFPKTLIVKDDYLYVGGDFSSIGGEQIPYLARISKCSGMTDLSWKPEIKSTNIFDPSVEKVAMVKNHLVVGGEFNYVNHTLQKNLAIFELPAVLNQTRCIAIGAGEEYAMAISSAGKLSGWGSNPAGELGNNSTTDSHVPMSVDTSGALSGKSITKVSLGGAFTIALSSSGDLFSWGNNAHGQLGNNSLDESHVPVHVETSGVLSGKTITDIAAGGYQFALAVSSEGKVYAWGDNEFGQLGIGSTQEKKTPVAINTTGTLLGKKIVSVAAGFIHSMALSSEGKVYAWGDNKFGELGYHIDGENIFPAAVDTTGVLKDKKIIAIAAGTFFSLALDSEGYVYAWGFNAYGQLGDKTKAEQDSPVAVYSSGALYGKKIIAIAAGGQHALALASDGTVYGWGDNAHGQLGNHTMTTSNVPVAIDASILKNKRIVAISAGNDFSMALTCDGEVYCWGGNENGQLGNNSTTDSYMPVKVNWPLTGIEQYSDSETVGMNLSQNYPNPFKQSTIIHYTVPKLQLGVHREMVIIKVFDLTGRQVAILVHQQQAPGNYSVGFDASRLRSGYYFYSLQAGNYTEVKKMVLEK